MCAKYGSAMLQDIADCYGIYRNEVIRKKHNLTMHQFYTAINMLKKENRLTLLKDRPETKQIVRPPAVYSNKQHHEYFY